MSNIVDSNFGNSAHAHDIETYLADAAKDSLKYAFDKKFTVHAGKGSAALPKEDVPARYLSLLSGLKDPTAIYIHMPFCKTKCLYCGFAGKTPEDELSNAYIDALIKEARFLGSLKAVRNLPVRAVYLGGGTPTAMPPEGLAKLMEALRQNFDLANDCEITLEGRVSDLVHADAFIDAGFSRFSIGVQSFDTNIRKRLGRINTGEEVVELLGRLINMHKAAVIIDLIYGLPGQSVEDFVADLKLAETIGVDGLDTYQLNVFPNSKLFRAIEEGVVPPAADLDQQGAYYKAANDYLIGSRWKQLSNSHYGRTSLERNIYNPWVKSKNNCIAMGAGAGGCLNGWDTYRLPVVEKYMGMAQSGSFYPNIMKAPDIQQKIHANVVAEIEKGAFNYGRLFSEHNISREPLQSVMQNWEQCGLVTMNDDWMDLTVNGKFWGVNLTQAIINILDIKQ